MRYLCPGWTVGPYLVDFPSRVPRGSDDGQEWNEPHDPRGVPRGSPSTRCRGVTDSVRGRIHPITDRSAGYSPEKAPAHCNRGPHPERPRCGHAAFRDVRAYQPPPAAVDHRGYPRRQRPRGARGPSHAGLCAVHLLDEIMRTGASSGCGGRKRWASSLVMRSAHFPSGRFTHSPNLILRPSASSISRKRGASGPGGPSKTISTWLILDSRDQVCTTPAMIRTSSRPGLSGVNHTGRTRKLANVTGQVEHSGRVAQR